MEKSVPVLIIHSNPQEAAGLEDYQVLKRRMPWIERSLRYGSIDRIGVQTEGSVCVLTALWVLILALGEPIKDATVQADVLAREGVVGDHL